MHQKLHDRHEEHEHDEVVDRDLHEGISRVSAGEMTPDEYHGRAGRCGQDDTAGNVLIRFGRRDKRCKENAEKDPGEQRHRKGLNHPIHE